MGVMAEAAADGSGPLALDDPIVTLAVGGERNRFASQTLDRLENQKQSAVRPVAIAEG